jgi:hypothetical protein
MGSYRVSFYNELSNSRGQVFKVFQRSVEVPSARSIERAVAAAKKRFEEEEGVNFWGFRARSYEIERLRAAGQPEDGTSGG